MYIQSESPRCTAGNLLPLPWDAVAADVVDPADVDGLGESVDVDDVVVVEVVVVDDDEGGGDDEDEGEGEDEEGLASVNVHGNPRSGYAVFFLFVFFSQMF